MVVVSVVFTFSLYTVLIKTIFGILVYSYSPTVVVSLQVTSHSCVFESPVVWRHCWSYEVTTVCRVPSLSLEECHLGKADKLLFMYVKMHSGYCLYEGVRNRSGSAKNKYLKLFKIQKSDMSI